MHSGGLQGDVSRAGREEQGGHRGVWDGLRKSAHSRGSGQSPVPCLGESHAALMEAWEVVPKHEAADHSIPCKVALLPGQ